MKAFASATRPRKMYGAFPRDYQLLRAPGDPVYYLVEVTPEQAELLGWINL